jgi:hypothetical protein
MCTPFTKITFAGNTTSNGVTRAVDQTWDMPEPSIHKWCYSKQGDSLTFTAWLPNGHSISNTLSTANGRLKGTIRIMDVHGQIDGVGKFH